jgi:hypothetical protein
VAPFKHGFVEHAVDGKVATVVKLFATHDPL